MRKQPILKETRENTAKTFQTPDLPSGDAKPDLLPVIEREKASRVSISRQLDVLEYQPCERDSARPLLSGWHLLFFARTGTRYIQALRAALQHVGADGAGPHPVPCADPRDEQLMQCFKRIQAQYRQHAARDAQTVSESVASQPVIAEIRYGGLTVASGFWLPSDMEMGLCLLPSTGGRLAAELLTVVEHFLDAPSASLDVLMVTLPAPRTKAEQAARQYTPGDGLDVDRERHEITLSTPVFCFFGAVTVLAAGITYEVGLADAAAAVGATVAFGYKPPMSPAEDSVSQRVERVREIRGAPSVSRLIEARRQLLVGNKTR